jgi:lichenan operon transcriptional antiterminator
METLLDIKVPELEKHYLKTCIQGHRYHVPMIRETEKSQIRERNQEMFDYVAELLLEVDRKYLTELSGDEELVCSLFEHVECMVYRIKSKMFTSNPILNSIKKEMFFEYDIASYLASKVSKKYQIEVTEDEIGYVAFHIGASIERLRQRKKENVRVTIICMSGIGSSQFVSMKLKRLFPELEVVQIISENRAESLKPETQDFVIATIPLTLENIKVITVSSLLNEADVKKIQEFVRKKKNPDTSRTASYFHLKQYLHESITILNCDLRSQEEVIQLLGGRMMREDFVDEGYVSSVAEREKVSETAVGSLLAIPHAFEGHIQKQGIGFMTLQRPVLWGNEKVQVILMLALSAEKENNFQGIFEEVVELTKDPKLVERILKAKRFDELNDIL